MPLPSAFSSCETIPLTAQTSPLSTSPTATFQCAYLLLPPLILPALNTHNFHNSDKPDLHGPLSRTPFRSSRTPLLSHSSFGISPTSGKGSTTATLSPQRALPPTTASTACRGRGISAFHRATAWPSSFPARLHRCSRRETGAVLSFLFLQLLLLHSYNFTSFLRSWCVFRRWQFAHSTCNRLTSTVPFTIALYHRPPVNGSRLAPTGTTWSISRTTSSEIPHCDGYPTHCPPSFSTACCFSASITFAFRTRSCARCLAYLLRANILVRSSVFTPGDSLPRFGDFPSSSTTSILA